MELATRVSRVLRWGQNRKMIREAGLWFIDIPRTSSTSIKVALGQRFGPTYGKSNVIESEHATRQWMPDHVTARTMRRYLGARTWDGLETFTIVRNPWDRALSLYFYCHKTGEIPREWSFSDYVKRLVDATVLTPNFRFHGLRLGMTEFLLDRNDVVLVKHIVRYEDRAAGLAELSVRLGVSELASDVRLQGASPAAASYREAYDDESRALVAARYAKDIRVFGYEF